MTNTLRQKLDKSTKEIFGKLNELSGMKVWDVFGYTKAPQAGASNYFDTEAFFAQVNVHVGDNYDYVYNQMKLESKPAKFFRYTAGIKLTEEQAMLDTDSLQSMVENAAIKQERGLRSKMEYNMIGYAGDVDYSVLKLGAAANPTIIDPYDCNSTSGTVEPYGAINFTGAGKTALNLNSTVGNGIRAISAATLDSTTGESILRNDGTDTFDLWCHPRQAQILRTNHDLLNATGGDESDKTYAEELATAWNTTIRPTMALGACTGIADATTVMVLTANTKENFFAVEVENPHWKEWKEIDNGEKIEFVKRFKAGIGALARPYYDNSANPYKAMFAMSVTPNGA
ncbi:hypothetical protein [Candidatus Lokiarchaeum ossiferum]|uniref:hypothetical protein n=1 Tax=Candidatus Lokiarchaeum ossiferum TaxID=2951803 RepID=UPI00352CF271